MRELAAILTAKSRNRLGNVLVFTLVALLALAMPFAANAQTLRGTSFVTESGDHSVHWNDNWTASLTAEDDFSTMVMLEGQIMIYAVMFIHDENLGLSERAIYYSLSGVLVNSFDSPPTLSVEWEEDDGSFRGAHLLKLSGIDFVLFLRVDPAQPGTGPSMQFAAAPLRAFPVSLQAMQDELTIDGVPVFDGEDGEEVLLHLEGDSSNAGNADSASDTEVSEAEAPAAEAPSDSDSELPLDERSRVQRDPQATRAQSSGHQFTSSTHGFTVEFTDKWLDMADTNATIGEFSLQSESGRSVVSFTGRSTTETNRQAFFEDIVVRESRYPGYVDSVISDDRLLIATWTNDNELAILEYVFVNDSTVVTVMVTITSGNPDRYIEEVQEITLEGEPILRDWDELWGVSD